MDPRQIAPCPEEITDLARADIDITGGHVQIRPDKWRHFPHQGLTKAHDLGLGSPVRIEIGAALAPAEGKTGKRILEALLEPQKLERVEADRWVKPQASLVWPDDVRCLHPPCPVDGDLTRIRFPCHTKRQDAVRFGQPVQDPRRGKGGFVLFDRQDIAGDLFDSLQEIALALRMRAETGDEGFGQRVASVHAVVAPLSVHGRSTRPIRPIPDCALLRTERRRARIVPLCRGRSSEQAAGAARLPFTTAQTAT